MARGGWRQCELAPAQRLPAQMSSMGTSSSSLPSSLACRGDEGALACAQERLVHRHRNPHRETRSLCVLHGQAGCHEASSHGQRRPFQQARECHGQLGAAANPGWPGCHARHACAAARALDSRRAGGAFAHLQAEVFQVGSRVVAGATKDVGVLLGSRRCRHALRATRRGHSGHRWLVNISWVTGSATC